MGLVGWLFLSVAIVAAVVGLVWYAVHSMDSDLEGY